jgi:hypothetical protein
VVAVKTDAIRGYEVACRTLADFDTWLKRAGVDGSPIMITQEPKVQIRWTESGYGERFLSNETANRALLAAMNTSALYRLFAIERARLVEVCRVAKIAAGNEARAIIAENPPK